MENARNIKLILEYEGTGLAGWQRQARDLTIQGHLETALARICNHPVTVIGAGRTDAGVHARGQAANFKTTSPRTADEIVRGGNALLPDQIVIRSAVEVPADFHARYHAKSKVYDYDLYLSPVPSALSRNFVWHLAAPLDLEDMAAGLRHLIGQHDFASFQSTGTIVQNTVRRMISAVIEKQEDGLARITLEADGFLRHMVRAIVGTLVMVGEKRISPDEFRIIMEAKDRGLAGPTAPARGLCLREVRY